MPGSLFKRIQGKQILLANVPLHYKIFGRYIIIPLVLLLIAQAENYTHYEELEEMYAALETN